MESVAYISKLVYLIILVLGSEIVFCQAQENKPKRPVDVDFMFNYYEQEGNHSPVTGGIGTEALTNTENVTIVHIPVDSAGKLDITHSINFYTTASTDRIDTRISSASRNDIHWQVGVNYEKEKPEKSCALSLSASASTESDYLSSSLGVGYKKWSKDRNNFFSAGFKAYFDTWILIFPQELRPVALADAPTDKRRSYILDLSYTRVLTKRIQGSFFIEPVYQTGMLATPFHRVFFADTNLVRIEKLPTSRFKLPMGVRFNSFIGNSLILRLYSRYYWDDFGIVASTSSIEPVFKLSSSLSVYPFYRYHIQSATKYFAPYQTHSLTESYYTSDYDLSAINGHKVGLGIQFSPVLIKKTVESKSQRRALRSMALRYSQYYRSDGLSFWMISAGLSFSF